MGTSGSNELEIDTQLDLYDPEVAEVLLFQNGIQVKQQKQSRLSRYQRDNASISKLPGIITDIALLQKRDGTFEYVTAPIDANGQGSFDLGQVLKAKTVMEYSSVATPLKLVAITDGARSIARQLRSAFGEELVMILDWYHLCKKLHSMMSMIAQDKEDKAAHLKVLIPKLWLGQVDDAIKYLETQVTPRREDKWRELTRYLGKHKAEIVNYNRRSRAGKTIGTGRMERGSGFDDWATSKEERNQLAAQRKPSFGVTKGGRIEQPVESAVVSKASCLNTPGNQQKIYRRGFCNRTVISSMALK